MGVRHSKYNHSKYGPTVICSSGRSRPLTTSTTLNLAPATARVETRPPCASSPTRLGVELPSPNASTRTRCASLAVGGKWKSSFTLVDGAICTVCSGSLVAQYESRWLPERGSRCQVKGGAWGASEREDAAWTRNG